MGSFEQRMANRRVFLRITQFKSFPSADSQQRAEDCAALLIRKANEVQGDTVDKNKHREGKVHVDFLKS